MNRLTRRSFLGTGTLAGVLATHGDTAGGAESSSSKPAIRYRNLGSTGFKVSEVSFGAMNMRDPELVHAAIDSGVNYIDTAHKYMNGVNEEVIGKVMETKRDKVFLTTKLADETIPDFPKMIELSLKRLKTDHVDLLLAHSLNTVDLINNEDILKHLDNAKRKGQTRFVGYSTHQFPDEYLEATLKAGFYQAILATFNYQSGPEVIRNLKKIREAGLAVIAMKTQMNGAGVPERADSMTTPHQAALKWVLGHDFVDTVIPGVTSFEQLAENTSVMGMKLTSDDLHDLRRFSDNLRGSYCHGVLGCTGCKDKCPNGVAIHEINRCLGYAIGYNDIRLARENFSDLPFDLEKCAGCGECQIECINGLNLTNNIRRAQSIFT